MERCGRCEAEGRRSEIKGKAHEVVGPNGLRMVVCNLCYTEIKDEVVYNENEEN
jgi:hypothetical protein